MKLKAWLNEVGWYATFDLEALVVEYTNDHQHKYELKNLKKLIYLATYLVHTHSLPALFLVSTDWYNSDSLAATYSIMQVGM